MDEITRADVEHQYPNWKLSEGTDQLYYGRRAAGAALTARGESWQDLLDEIRRKEASLWAPGNDMARRYWQR